MRLIPKRASVRAVTNMRGALRNGALYPCMHVLRSLFAQQQATRQGLGVRSKADVYRRIRAFKQSHPAGPYFVACLDIGKCFDSVDSRRLYDEVLELVAAAGRLGEGVGRPREELLSSAHGYTVHRYSVLRWLRGGAARGVVRCVSPHALLFGDAASRVGAHFADSIVSDGAHARLGNARLLALLRAHLFEHTVRIPQEDGRRAPHLQMRGLPQGSALSPLLCDLFYGALEHELLTDPALAALLRCGLLMRQTDDYLLVSTDRHALGQTHWHCHLHALTVLTLQARSCRLCTRV